MKTFVVETEGDFDERIILDALKDDFPEDDFKVREVHYCRNCAKYRFGYCKTVGFSEACKHFEENKIKHS